MTLEFTLPKIEYLMHQNVDLRLPTQRSYSNNKNSQSNFIILPNKIQQNFTNLEQSNRRAMVKSIIINQPQYYNNSVLQRPSSQLY
jgi:hypothetical protein